MRSIVFTSLNVITILATPILLPVFTPIAEAKSSCFSKNFYQTKAIKCTPKNQKIRSLYTSTTIPFKRTQKFNAGRFKNLPNAKYPNLIQISGGPLNHAITIKSTTKVANAAMALIPKTAALHIRCLNDKTTVLFDFANNQMSNAKTSSEILYAIDGGKDELLGLSISKQNNILGLWNGRLAVPFTKQLLGKKHLKVNAWNAQGDETIYQFNITNLDNAIGNLRNACNW